MSATADKAVLHVLRRIIDDPRLAYHFDPLTESFQLLTAAYAEAQGKDVAEVRRGCENRMRFEEPLCSECREVVS